MGSPLQDKSKAFARIECAESEYWLELLIENGYYEDNASLVLRARNCNYSVAAKVSDK